MGRTEAIVQLACYLLPALAFFGAAYLIITKWESIQKDKMKLQKYNAVKGDTNQPVIPSAEKNSTIFPMQVDAYQRVVLFLERISPNNMVMRLNNPILPAKAFQQMLLDNIRNEYEHNLAQQIFISQEGWNLARNSKDETIKIINMAGTKMGPTSMCLDLSRTIFEITAQLHNQPTERAIIYLKTEFNALLEKNQG